VGSPFDRALSQRFSASESLSASFGIRKDERIFQSDARIVSLSVKLVLVPARKTMTRSTTNLLLKSKPILDQGLKNNIAKWATYSGIISQIKFFGIAIRANGCFTGWFE